MADWVTISQVATAGGTLVLAVATFTSIRAAQASTRLAERALLAGTRPLLVPSGAGAESEQVRFGDDITITVPPHSGAAVIQDAGVYLGLSLHNGGAGMAVIHAWQASVVALGAGAERPDTGGFRRQQLDILIPAAATGVWRGAIREADENAQLRRAIQAGDRIFIDLLYGDLEGGQRTVARFALPTSRTDNNARCEVLRYWSVDGSGPR